MARIKCLVGLHEWVSESFLAHMPGESKHSACRYCYKRKPSLKLMSKLWRKYWWKTRPWAAAEILVRIARWMSDDVDAAMYRAEGAEELLCQFNRGKIDADELRRQAYAHFY